MRKLLLLAGFALAAMSAQAGTVISENFSGGVEVDLVGTATPDGNHWTGGQGERTKGEESAGGTGAVAEAHFSIKQDGSVGGIAFTAYHKFTLEQGRVYTLEAELDPTNRADNQWLTVGFCVTARDGERAPNLDACTTYGQTVLTGSGYRYGWAGPDTKDMCELEGPGLYNGPVRVVLDTSDASNYTIELFDGGGDSIHGPELIGAPAISQVFIGNSATEGSFKSLKLSDRAPVASGKVRPQAVASPVVVMLGDSTTDRGMPTVVKKQLDALIGSPLKRPEVINAGKGGDNATSALERLEKDVLAHRPDIVTVSFGLNDTGGRKPEQYGESLEKIVETLKAAGIKVVLMTSTPFNNDRHFWGKDFESQGGLDEYMDREFCARVRALAASEKVQLCDLHAIFKAQIDKDPGLIDKVISTDGVHLTAEGYDLVAKHIAPVLQQLLTGKAAKSVEAEQ